MVIFLDGADLETMKAYESRVAGVTTNPSLMSKAGIDNYKSFAAAVLMLTNKPVSFEVFADDLDGMERQAREIASWGENVWVKIPVTNTHGVSTANLCRTLGMEGIKLNVTAICAMEQIETVARSLIYAPAIISIFAGRIADTGRDVSPFFAKALRVKAPQTQVLWASTREIYNVTQAEQVGADIITVTPAMIQKMLEMRGVDLNLLSITTVKQFWSDSKGITL